MTPEEPAAPAAASVGWMLRLGARATVSSVLAVLALAGVISASQVVWRTLPNVLFFGDPALRLQRTLLLSGAALLVLTSLVRAVVLAVAVHAGAERLRSAAPNRSISPARAGLRGIAWAAVAVLVDQLLGLWFWGVLLASGVAAFLGGPVISLLGISGVALALTLGLFLGPAAALWLELGMVASVVRPARFGEAASISVGTLLARPGAVVALWLLTAVPAGFLAAGVQVLQAGAPGPSPAAAAAGGVAVILVGLIEALATLLRLDALAALVLDRMAELPPAPVKPRAEPVPVATLVPPTQVVEARPVGPMTPWGEGGPR